MTNSKQLVENIKVRKVVELVNQALAIFQEDSTKNSYIALKKGQLTELLDSGRIPSQMEIDHLISLSMEATKADPRAGIDAEDKLMELSDFYHTVRMLPTKKLSLQSTLLKAFGAEHDKSRRKAEAEKDGRLNDYINAILSSIETLGQETLYAQSKQRKEEQEGEKENKGNKRLSFPKPGGD